MLQTKNHEMLSTALLILQQRNIAEIYIKNSCLMYSYAIITVTR